LSHLFKTLIAAHCLGANVQINDAALDTVHVLPSTRPLVNASSSGAHLAAHGANLVAAYQATTGANVVPDGNGAPLVERLPRPEKSWLAIGPDPQQRERDNLYLTWTEIDLATGATLLRFARSTDP
jgi:hypothetical protein